MAAVAQLELRVRQLLKKVTNAKYNSSTKAATDLGTAFSLVLQVDCVVCSICALLSWRVYPLQQWR